MEQKLKEFYKLLKDNTVIIKIDGNDVLRVVLRKNSYEKFMRLKRELDKVIV